MENTSVSELLARGVAAARAGDKEDAQRLLRRVTELDPGHVDAWIWRASVADTSADKKAYLQEALSLDPDNADARLALEKITEREGELAARAEEDDVLYCATHPDRETMLRCNRCGRAMCTECSVRHPVGLRCRDCVVETRSPIYQVDTVSFAKSFLAATIVGAVIGVPVLLLGPLVLRFGFFGLIIAFFLGGALGRTIAETVQRTVPRKRGRPVQAAVGIGTALGLGVVTLGWLLMTGTLPSLLLIGLYLATAIPSAIATVR